jgi:uncharacterized protein YgiM (DUF1202 family)
MKSNFWLLGGSLWLATASVWAQDNARDNATTNGPRRIAGVAKSVVMETPAAGKVVNLESLNVRSEPNFTSDILTHLHRGQMVLVFEQLTLSKPKPNEPTNWARIGLPTNAPVWVAAQYVDTNTMTVSARRVNVRGGPSDNYTIVCRLEKGAPVQEVARRPDWIQIVPPTNAFGYVAAEYLNVEPATAPPATPAPAENAGVAVAAAPTPPPAAPTNPVAEAAVAAPATNATAVVSAAPDASTTNAAPTNPVAAAEPTAQIVAPDPVAAAPAPAPTTPTNTITPAAAEASPPVGAATDAASTETKLRVVTREGYIRRTYNIQAPTDFVLHEAESGEITEYIQPDPKDKTFKKYVGTRVLVTGSEWLDRRWPTRPILKVENIELLP